MTDSTERPPEENTAEAIQKRMEKYPSKQHHEKTEISELPRWVKTAFVMKDVDGLTYKDVAERFGRSPKTLSKYASSPAAQKWRARIQEWADDPINVAEAYMKGNALSVTLDRIAFLEMAIQAGDYKEGDKIARDIQDRIGLTRKKSADDSTPSLTIVLPGGAEPQMIEAEYEVLEEE